MFSDKELLCIGIGILLFIVAITMMII